MQQFNNPGQSARVSASLAMIKQAIHDRACLSGTYVEFRVRFAPHALGRDENDRHTVFAFEYGGLTLGRAHWVCFAVHRLRRLQRTRDPWRSGPLQSRPPFDLTEVEAAVDHSWSKPIGRHLRACGQPHGDLHFPVTRVVQPAIDRLPSPIGLLASR